MAQRFAREKTRMPEQEYLSVWNTYLSAWSEISAEERALRLGRCVTDDCVYTDPTDQRHGRNDLIARIELSKQKYPGAHFVNDNFLHHHGQGLCHWTMYDGEGKVLAKGTSYSRLSEDGRLQQMTGFF